MTQIILQQNTHDDTIRYDVYDFDGGEFTSGGEHFPGDGEWTSFEQLTFVETVTECPAGPVKRLSDALIGPDYSAAYRLGTPTSGPAPRAGSEADRHGPGCAWFDGVACDCAG